MGCKSALYAANTAAQALTAGSVINFGSVVRRFGCYSNASGGNVVLRGCGYYQVDGSLTLANAGEAAATATVSFYKDGVAITGATATVTIAAAASESIVIPFIVRETCDCESTITAVLSGAALTVNNAAVSVTKL